MYRLPASLVAALLALLLATPPADAVVLLTEWNQYRGLDLEQLRSQMRGNAFIDLRNVYERKLLEAHGFAYTCVGR